MKRRAAVLFVLVVLMVLVVVPASAVDRISTQVKNVEVSVDPRMELLSAVQLLTTYGKYGPIIQQDFQYKRDMQKYFAPYKDHRAVVLFERMCWKGFHYDLPAKVMVCVSNPPALKFQPGFSANVRKTEGRHISAEGETQIREFVEAMRDFAVVSDFDRFYSDHTDVYKAMVHEVASRLERVEIMESFEAYFGRDPKARYRLVLMPMSVLSYGVYVERAHGVKEVYNVMAPAGVRDDMVTFARVDSICQTLWHEFGHSIVNPLSAKNRTILKHYASLYEPIYTKMKRQEYRSWEACVNEHVLHAVTVRLYQQVRGDKAGADFAAGARSVGFVYIDALCKRLEEYEKNRDKYPTFESFYPQLLDVFKQLQEQNLGPEFYRKDPSEPPS